MAEAAAVKKLNIPEPGPGLASLVMASVAAILLAGVFAFSCLELGSEGEFVLDNRINPNIATAGLLMQLPRIGPKKAEAIIEYRGGFQSGTAFESVENLQKVKGIGPKTAEEIRRWLIFE